MEETKVDPQLLDELSTAHQKGLASGKLMTPLQSISTYRISC